MGIRLVGTNGKWIVEGLPEESTAFVAGIRDGDLLVSVGGMEPTPPGTSLMWITEKLGDRTEADVVVIRDDTVLTFTVERELLTGLAFPPN